MPLDVSTIQPGLIIRAAHLTQFYSLLTGITQDQPVSLAHQLTVGGGAVIGPGIVPLTIHSQTAQTANVLEVRDPSSNLVFAVSSSGSINLAGTLTAGQITVTGGVTIDGFVTAPLNVGTPNERVTNPPLNTAHLVLESTDGYVFVEGLSGAHLAGNAYWDGANWNLFNTAQPGAFWVANSSGVSLDALSVGANPRTPATVLTIDRSGNLNATGDITGRWLHTTDGTNGLIQASTGSLYLRTAGGANSVIMDTGSGGLLVTAGPIQAGTNIYAPSGWVAAGTVLSGTLGDLSANRNNGTGYVFLANGSHYLGFDGSQYQLPTSNLNVVSLTSGGAISGGAFTAASLNVSGTISTAAINSNDWFRVNAANIGLYNNVTATGIQLVSGGQLLYPSGDQIVGINTAQTLSNKIIAAPVVSSYFAYGAGSIGLPANQVGRLYAIKAWGGALTVTGSNIVYAGASGLGSVALNNGDSLTFYSDGVNWWVI